MSTPNANERYVIGSLPARGIRIQRWGIRQILQEIDPVGRSLRRSQAIRRRVNSVQTPNELWYVCFGPLTGLFLQVMACLTLLFVIPVFILPVQF